jgi:hypothetical protein
MLIGAYRIEPVLAAGRHQVPAACARQRRGAESIVTVHEAGTFEGREYQRQQASHGARDEECG